MKIGIRVQFAAHFLSQTEFCPTVSRPARSVRGLRSLNVSFFCAVSIVFVCRNGRGHRSSHADVFLQQDRTVSSVRYQDFEPSTNSFEKTLAGISA